MAVSFVAASDSGDAAEASSHSTAVPSGVQSGDIVVAFVETWQGNVTVTPPSGFTQKGTGGAGSSTFSSGDGAARNYVYWKRLTGADSGSYSFGLSATRWTTVQAMAFRGCVATGDPFDAVPAGAGVTGTFGSVTSISLTITDGDGVQIFTAYNDTSGTHTPPSGFTEPTGVDQDCASCAYKLNGGTTGSVSVSGASISSSSSAGAWAGALLSAGGAAATSLVIPRRPARGLILR